MQFVHSTRKLNHIRAIFDEVRKLAHGDLASSILFRSQALLGTSDHLMIKNAFGVLKGSFQSLQPEEKI